MYVCVCVFLLVCLCACMLMRGIRRGNTRWSDECAAEFDCPVDWMYLPCYFPSFLYMVVVVVVLLLADDDEDDDVFNTTTMSRISTSIVRPTTTNIVPSGGKRGKEEEEDESKNEKRRGSNVKIDTICVMEPQTRTVAFCPFPASRLHLLLPSAVRSHSSNPVHRPSTPFQLLLHRRYLLT